MTSLRNVDHRHFRDETVDRPSTWFVPGRTAGPSEVYERKGYVLRVRGDTAAARERAGIEERRIPREFWCPVHGRFTLEVDELTGEVACTQRSWSCAATGEQEFATREACEDAVRAAGLDLVEVGLETQACGLTASWSPSSVGQGKSAGEVMG